jgi:hypothetical protein
MNKIILILLVALIPIHPLSIILENPNGGETFSAGEIVEIKWACDTAYPMTIEYSLDNGGFWKLAADNTLSGHLWTVPFLKDQCDQVLLRVFYNHDHQGVDESDGNFTILACQPDAYEPNNDLKSAVQISMGDTLKDLLLAIDLSVDSNNVETDYFKFQADSGNLVTIYAIPEYRDNATGMYAYNNTDEKPQIHLLNSKGGHVEWIDGTGILNYPIKTSGSYYIAIKSHLSWPPSIDLGWYQYSLTVFETGFEKVDLLEADQDSTWIDSLQKYLFTANITGFSCGISIYLESIGGPGEHIAWCILREFPPVPKSASYEDILIFTIDIPDYAKDKIIKAEITIPYNEADLGGSPESALYLNDSLNIWENVDFTLDMDNNTVTIHTTHFSTYGLFAGNKRLIVKNDISQETRYALSAYPMPCKTSVTFNILLPERKAVDLSLYNPKGQKIINIVNKELEKGGHFVKWNGKDISNCQLASGIYLAVLNYGQRRLQRRVIIVK